MKKFKLLFVNILFFMMILMGGVPVYASSFEGVGHVQTSLEADKSFSILVGFGGKNVMAVQTMVSYESEKLELLSVMPVSTPNGEFTITSGTPKDDNEYKKFMLLADSDHVFQNVNYAVLRFKVKEDFKVGSMARIFFKDFLAAGPYKTEFKDVGFYYTITRDEDMSLDVRREKITEGTDMTIWLEDNFLLIIGGVLAFIIIVFILTHLPTGKLENRERKVINKNKKIKVEKKAGFYDKDAAIPEFKNNKVKDKIDVVPFNPFNSNPNNFNGTNNNQNNNPVPNNQQNGNNGQFFNPFGNNNQGQNNQAFNPLGNNNGQQVNAFENNSPQQMNAFNNNSNAQAFNPLENNDNKPFDPFGSAGNIQANNEVDENAKPIEPVFMTNALNDKKKKKDSGKFFDESVLDGPEDEPSDLFIVPPIEDKKDEPVIDTPINAFDTKPAEDDLDILEELDDDADNKKDKDDDMDMLVFVLLLLLPVGLLFFSNVKAAEYKVDELRKCIVKTGDCTEELNYSKSLGNETDNEYTVLDLIYTKNLDGVQSEIVAEDEIAKITTEAITFPTASTEPEKTTTKVVLGDNKYMVTLKKKNSTTDSLDASEEVQENGSVSFTVTPNVGYGDIYTLDCDKSGIGKSYLEMEGKVIIDGVTANTTCTINFKVNNIELKFKEIYNVQDENDITKKVQTAKDVPITKTYKYGDSLTLELVDIPGYEYRTVTCETNEDVNYVNVEGDKIHIKELKPADGRKMSCNFEYVPTKYTVSFKWNNNMLQTYNVEYNSDYEFIFNYNSRYNFKKVECSNGETYNVTGILEGNVRKYTVKYKHNVLKDVVCKMDEGY